MGETKARTEQLHFKDPDLLFELSVKLGGETEEARRSWSEKYTEWGDYGCVELNLDAGTFVFLPKEKWQ